MLLVGKASSRDAMTTPDLRDEAMEMRCVIFDAGEGKTYMLKWWMSFELSRDPAHSGLKACICLTRASNRFEVFMSKRLKHERIRHKLQSILVRIARVVAQEDIQTKAGKAHETRTKYHAAARESS